MKSLLWLLAGNVLLFFYYFFVDIIPSISSSSQIYYVAEGNPQLLILLFPLAKCWDYRWALPCLVLGSGGIELRARYMLGKPSSNWAMLLVPGVFIFKDEFAQASSLGTEWGVWQDEMPKAFLLSGMSVLAGRMWQSSWFAPFKWNLTRDLERITTMLGNSCVEVDRA